METKNANPKKQLTRQQRFLANMWVKYGIAAFFSGCLITIVLVVLQCVTAPNGEFL